MMRILMTCCFALVSFCCFSTQKRVPASIFNRGLYPHDVAADSVAHHCLDSATFTARIMADIVMNEEDPYPVTFTVPANAYLADVQIDWSWTSGQIVQDTSYFMTFIPAKDPNIKFVTISLVFTDVCGQKYSAQFSANVTHCSKLSFVPDINIASNLSDDQQYTATLVVPNGIDLKTYHIQWTVPDARIIGSDAGGQITFYPPLLKEVTSSTITVALTNDCYKTFTANKVVQITHSAKNGGLVTAVKLVSPNGDGIGYDFLYLENIEHYPENEVTIYSRWGSVIYKARGYDNDKVKFAGLNTSDKKVNDGVFYYIVKINSVNVPMESAFLKGYFILKR